MGMLILLLVVLVSAQSSGVTVGGFFEPVECQANLEEADADEDGKISPDEFVVFAQLSAAAALTPTQVEQIFDDVNDYESLPTALQVAFLVLACLCNDPEFGGTEDGTCCVGNAAHIRVVDVNSTDSDYLVTVCARTNRALEQVLNPSSSPTTAPTDEPTGEPTDEPTDEPTGEPTPEPTQISSPPTRRPVMTPSPIALPPTRRPVMAPTSPPVSALPTRRPVKVPTSSPTRRPALPQTDSPTAESTVEELARVVYQIAIPAGTSSPESSYYSDLITAMNQLATQVAAGYFEASRRQLRQNRRRLLVKVLLPTAIGDDVTTFSKCFCYLICFCFARANLPFFRLWRGLCRQNKHLPDLSGHSGRDSPGVLGSR
jgi:outer membrane biosynthesis protein TonB